MALRLEDDELIDAFQRGDERVFDLVVGEHRDSLHRHAMRRLRDAAAAEDAVQETFLRAYRSFGRLRLDSRIASWLHQIMANVCIDEANRRQRHLIKLERSIDPMITRFVEPGPEERLGLNRPDTSAIEAAIDQLPGSYQEALTMRFLDELSYEQMASATGTSSENARARVSRARTAVRSILRGVAVVPLIGAFMLRRTGRTAAALDRIGGADTAATATKAATSVAPAADTVATMVTAANHTIPLITKAAIGVGAVSMFAMTTAPERGPVPPPVPIEAAAESAASSGSGASSGSSAASSTGTGAARSDGTGRSVSPDSNPAAADAQPATAAPTAGGNGETAEAPAPEAAPVAPVPETTAVVAGNPGNLQMSNLSVSQSGPRLDISGTASLSVGNQVLTGPLTGRLRIDEGATPAEPRKLEGTLTVNLGGTMLEIRLQGLATPLDAAPAPAETPADPAPPSGTDAATPDPGLTDGADPATDEGSVTGASIEATDDVSGATATRFSWRGQFRVSGGQSVGLLAAGSFTGGFGSGSLTLTLLA